MDNFKELAKKFITEQENLSADDSFMVVLFAVWLDEKYSPKAK